MPAILADEPGKERSGPQAALKKRNDEMEAPPPHVVSEFRELDKKSLRYIEERIRRKLFVWDAQKVSSIRRGRATKGRGWYSLPFRKWARMRVPGKPNLEG